MVALPVNKHYTGDLGRLMKVATMVVHRRTCMRKVDAAQDGRHASHQAGGPTASDPIGATPANAAGSLVALQRVVGNAAVMRMVQAQRAAGAPADQGKHGRGCGCAACSVVSRSVQSPTIQRDGEEGSAPTEGETTASILNIRESPSTSAPILGTYPRGTKIQIKSQTTGTEVNGNAKWNETDRGFVSDAYVRHASAPDKGEPEKKDGAFDPEILKKAQEMLALGGSMTIPVFIGLASAAGVSLHDILESLFTYWATVALSDVEAKVKSSNADEKKGVWSDSALMTLADTKLGRDSYLTFVTHLGMHQAPTTDELGEGGKEHTPAPEADKLIRAKMDSYVANAVKAGKQVEGQVGVVGGTDWDRAGIEHYGEAVWKTGPPPKTPKRDAINGFVDSKGRVWIEQNSGNPGTMIHEGMHKYSHENYLGTLGFNMNEGTTEYFTRIICKDQGIDRGNYETQKKLIDTLVTNVTNRDTLAAAYFDGAIAGLKSAFIAYRKSKKGFFGNLFTFESTYETEWNDFVAKFGAGEYPKAEAYIK